MKAITPFVSGLLLSALLLLSASIHAADVQPFVMVKSASVNSLVSVAEKIAAMVGVADNYEFQDFLRTVKSIKGFNLNGIIGIGAATDDNDEISPILLLPITDLMRAEIPGLPDVFDQIRPFLVKRGDKYVINSPVGTYIAAQKKDYLVITSESIADNVPADTKNLFADLDKYILGVKFDLENVGFETLETTIFMPIQMMVAMTNPDAAEQFDNAIDMYRELYKEIGVLSYGFAFNPQNADVSLSMSVAPRKGSDMAKVLVETKRQPTAFNGFRGTPENTVFSLGDSSTYGKYENNALIELNAKQWETMVNGFLEGLLEQIDMEDESGDIHELAEEVVDSMKTIVETEQKRGISDYALSLNTEGTLLLAFDTGSLGEIRKIAKLVADFARQKDEELGGMIKGLFAEHVKQDYVTVEGFKVSSVKIPVDTLLAMAGSAPEGLTIAPGIFWASKDAGGKQAIAGAIGLDFAKAEQAFKSALEKTKTSAPVQQPMGTFSVPGLGKLFRQTVYPLAEAADAPEEVLVPFKKVIDIFATAGNDATITLTNDYKPEKVEGVLNVSGKVIQALISAGKVVAEESPMLNPGIRDF